MYFIYLLIFENKKIEFTFFMGISVNVCERESVVKAVESVHVHIAITVLRIYTSRVLCERVNLTTRTWCVCVHARFKAILGSWERTQRMNSHFFLFPLR